MNDYKIKVVLEQDNKIVREINSRGKLQNIINTVNEELSMELENETHNNFIDALNDYLSALNIEEDRRTHIMHSIFMEINNELDDTFSYYAVTNIEWCVEDEDIYGADELTDYELDCKIDEIIKSLPTIVSVPIDEELDIQEQINDYLSDKYGWLVESYNYYKLP